MDERVHLHAGTAGWILAEWCETDDIVLADSSLVAIHSAAGGPRKLLLPRACDVEDVVTGQPFARQVREINVELKSPDTRVFRMLPPAALDNTPRSPPYAQWKLQPAPEPKNLPPRNP